MQRLADFVSLPCQPKVLLECIDLGTELGVGLWYTVSGNFALGLEARIADDVTRYGVGFRLYFDK